MPAAPRTIGQVLESIRGEFPDISVSKVRYLENEGLISPERDHPSGYRRFYFRVAVGLVRGEALPVVQIVQIDAPEKPCPDTGCVHH